jgi:salicylate biosynthesis isochorismate synthase
MRVAAGIAEPRAEEALARARRRGTPVLASLSVEAGEELDPTAAAFAARRTGEPWFCLEQPSRDRRALAALGAALVLRADGEDRFARVARQWRGAVSEAVADGPAGSDGAGLVAVGGFAFAPAGGSSPQWAGFEPGALTVPELALWRHGERAGITATALVAPDDEAAAVAARLEERIGSVRHEPLPLIDPVPAARCEIASSAPPQHFESAVARAVELIQAGRLEKIVLAREVQVHAPARHDPGAVLGVLRDGFPDCYVYGVGSGEAAFVGATPELLVRREGQRASTLALAGSTRRSADPSVDDHLGEQLLRSAKDREEQAIVQRRIVRTLRDHSVWVTAPDEPVVVRMANIQHLATPVRAQLAQPVGAVELAGLLHPTPAVGGEPREAATGLIPALEGLDRGWYAGAIGWTDAAEDGEFCVALRCALLRGTVARCYAGVGVVRDSDPSAELAETEVKLQALLPVLAG